MNTRVVPELLFSSLRSSQVAQSEQPSASNIPKSTIRTRCSGFFLVLVDIPNVSRVSLHFTLAHYLHSRLVGLSIIFVANQAMLGENINSVSLLVSRSEARETQPRLSNAVAKQ